MKKILGHFLGSETLVEKMKRFLNKLEDALGHAINYSIDEQFQNILRCTSVTALVQLTKKSHSWISKHLQIFRYTVITAFVLKI